MLGGADVRRRSVCPYYFNRQSHRHGRVVGSENTTSVEFFAQWSSRLSCAESGFCRRRCTSSNLAIMPANGNMVSFTKVIIPALLGSFVPAYIFWDLARNRHIFGGAPALTYADPAWQKESLSKFDSGWEREAGSPVVMNPISRQSYRKL